MLTHHTFYNFILKTRVIYLDDVEVYSRSSTDKFRTLVVSLVLTRLDFGNNVLAGLSVCLTRDSSRCGMRLRD